MKGGKILNSLIASDNPAQAIRQLGNGKLRKATWQAVSRDGHADEKEKQVHVLCMAEAVLRFCGKGGGK